MLHHGSVWLVHNKKSYLILLCTFLAFFCCFSSQNLCFFFIFISFSDKVSNFRNRVLTNQKRELVISNCQRNCMFRLIVLIQWSVLNKCYLFQNKIDYLDKIYFCFSKIKLLKHTFKKETLAQVFSCEFCEISKNTFYRTPLGDCF